MGEAIAGRVVEDPLVTAEQEADEAPLGEARHLQQKHKQEQDERDGLEAEMQ